MSGGIIGSVYVGGNKSKGSINAKISNSYFVGNVNGNSEGAIAGYTEINTQNGNFDISFFNNYYLIFSCSGAVHGDKANGCTAFSSTALKACADMLGNPFVDNHEEEYNDEYPIFEWQSTPYQFKGSGIAEDPFQISSKYELEVMRDLVNSTYFGKIYNNYHYIQTADIDLNNERWIPIGKRMNDKKEAILPSFCGNYNGDGHKISNLYVNETVKFAGLFGELIDDGIIENLEVHGTVKSEGNSTGGVLGEMSSSTSSCIIRNCSFFGDVTTSGGEAGGVVGYLWQSGIVENCYHNGTVTNTNNSVAGGVVDHICTGKIYNANAYVKNCYHVGKVSGESGRIGSVAGFGEEFDKSEGRTFITNCYALNGDCSSVISGTATECNTLVLTPSLLKLIAEDLGEIFVKNPNNSFNNGYPIFKWQIRSIQGDVNADGEFNVSDVVLFQKWLLAVPDIELANWKNADFCKDDKLDVFDLCMMKRALIEQSF